MFESLVIMLREGIEIALVVGLMWVYLRKTGRSELIPAVVWGLIGGVLASLALAWGLHRLPLSKPIVEGTLMFVAAGFVLSMVLWMMRHARSVSGQIREKIDSLAQGSSSRAAYWGVALFTLLMVAREGFETVVFMTAVWVGDDASFLAAVGAVLGAALAIAFGVAFVRGSVHIDLRRFFKITGIVLLIFIAQLIFYGLHEYGEVGLMDWLPASALAFIDRVAHQNVLFILAIIAIPVLMLLIPGGQKQLTRPERTWRIAGACSGALVVFVLGLHYFNGMVQASRSDLPLLQPKAGVVEVELHELQPGVPAIFNVPEDGKLFPLVVLKQAGGQDGGEGASTVRVYVATGAVGAPKQFGLAAGKLVFYDDDGETFNPAHYEAEHLRQLTPVPFTLKGDDVYIEVEALEHAG